MAETTVRVEVFEILKQKSNNATKNIIILSTGENFVNMSSLDNLRPHQQSPRKTENNSHRFKTEDPMTVLVEVHRLPE